MIINYKRFNKQVEFLKKKKKCVSLPDQMINFFGKFDCKL